MVPLEFPKYVVLKGWAVPRASLVALRAQDELALRYLTWVASLALPQVAVVSKFFAVQSSSSCLERF